MLLEEILSPLYDKRTDLVPRQDVVSTITSMTDMFREYFQIDVSEGILRCVPLLLAGAEPAPSKLPFFLYRLGTKVDYLNEKICLSQILHELALLYVPPPVDQIHCNPISDLLENFVFPQVRLRLVAPATLMDHIVQLADLPGLYKVFERC